MPPGDRVEIQRVANGWIISPVRVSYMDPARAGEIHVATMPVDVLEAVRGFLLTELVVDPAAAERLQAPAIPTHPLEAPR